ncbi:MAG: hypothetical protein Nk1A_7090 [Endomicrobiia bacterium]|nr:MAG: hypothetical protein Nk1A_6500 [Endomicrobiia bacterium]GMO68352.1 MAG: hypothetical protein Nk1A_7090 [Endomicrobiia bacterium]
MPGGKRFSSEYQPSTENKVKGRKLATLRKQLLFEALDLDNVDASVWDQTVSNLRKEFLKENNIQTVLYIIDKLAPREIVARDQGTTEPLQLILSKYEADL